MVKFLGAQASQVIQSHGSAARFTFLLLPPCAFFFLSPDDATRDTFERVASLKDGSEEGSQVRVEMSFLEIYNENVFDLLAASSPVRRS